MFRAIGYFIMGVLLGAFVVGIIVLGINKCLHAQPPQPPQQPHIETPKDNEYERRPVAPPVRPDKASVQCLAQLLYWEARGEPQKGIIAAGYVVVERTRHPKWPRKICDVIFEPYQFSSRLNKDWAGPSDVVGKRIYRRLVDYATHILAGVLHNPVPGAVYFHSGSDPDWSKYDDVLYLGRIGHHKFYGRR